MLDNDLGAVRETGLPFRDLADQIVVAGKLPQDGKRMPFKGGDFGLPFLVKEKPPEGFTAILQSRVPFNLNRVKESLRKEGTVIKLKDREYYDIQSGPFSSIFVPTNRMIVFTSLPADKMDALLEADPSRPALDAETAGLVRKIDKSQMWMVVKITEAMRQESQLDLAAQMAPPEFKPLVTNFQQARAVALWGGVEQQQLRINLGVNFPEARMSQEVTQTVRGLWEQQVKLMAQQPAIQNQIKTLPPYLQDLANDALDRTKFSQQDTLAQVSVELRFQALVTLFKEVEEKGPGALMAALQPPQPVKPPPNPIKPPPPPMPPANFAEAEKDLLTLINEARDRDKLVMFKADPKLAVASRIHSDKQAKEMKQDRDLTPAVKDSGYTNRIINGYILTGRGKPAGKEVYEAIINSDEARKLLLDKKYDEIGIAFSRNDKEQVYITIIVGGPLK
jgi:uncharacterized protein YkwD